MVETRTKRFLATDCHEHLRKETNSPAFFEAEHSAPTGIFRGNSETDKYRMVLYWNPE